MVAKPTAEAGRTICGDVEETCWNWFTGGWSARHAESIAKAGGGLCTGESGVKLWSEELLLL